MYLDESLEARITSLYERFSATLTSDGDKGQGQTVMALSWITKALVLRGHGKSQKFADMV